MYAVYVLPVPCRARAFLFSAMVMMISRVQTPPQACSPEQQRAAREESIHGRVLSGMCVSHLRHTVVCSACRQSPAAKCLSGDRQSPVPTQLLSLPESVSGQGVCTVYGSVCVLRRILSTRLREATTARKGDSGAVVLANPEPNDSWRTAESFAPKHQCASSLACCVGAPGTSGGSEHACVCFGAGGVHDGRNNLSNRSKRTILHRRIRTMFC